jgi:transposase
MRKSIVYVGLDVHKDTIAVGMAVRREEPVLVTNIPNDWHALAQVLDRLGSAPRLRVCYEAGPTGYGLARRLNEAGVCCTVVAPSKIPQVRGRGIKTDRRDAKKLARLLRDGSLVEVKIPAAQTEAMRDLERARDDAKNAERVARHQLDKFLLRHGRICSLKSKWTRRHWAWIEEQAFSEEAQRRVLADAIRAAREATQRVERLEKDIEELVQSWALAPLARAFQALRGVRLLSAVILAAEIGDYARFRTPRELMGYIGLVPSEESSGQRRRQGGITRTGNVHVRRILTEAAWNYRFRPRPSRAIRARRVGLPPPIVSIAEKAEQRLSRRYQHLMNRGKNKAKAVTAVARELAGFVWAIAREVQAVAK